MSDIEEFDYEEVHFGTERSPAWRRWEGIEGSCDGDTVTSNPNLLKDAVNGISLRTDDIIQYLRPGKNGLQYEDSAEQSRAETLNETAKRCQYKEVNVKSLLRRPTLPGKNGLQYEDIAEQSRAETLNEITKRCRYKEVNVKSLLRRPTLVLGSPTRLSSVLEGDKGYTESEGTDDNPMDESFLSSDEKESSSSSSSSSTKYIDGPDSPSSSDDNEPDRYLDNEPSTHKLVDTGVGEGEPRGKFVLSKEGGDHNEVLVCNGQVGTVIFGPCTVTEKREQNDQNSEELKLAICNLSRECTQIKQLCAQLVKYTSQMAVSTRSIPAHAQNSPRE